MGKLWDDIIRFVDTEVIPELLLAKLQSRGKPKPAIAHIKIDNHPSLLETKLVKLTTSSYTITIPRNWIFRLCLIFQLVDSMENADESRSRIYIFDTDHAFEAHFFDVTNDSKASFFSVPDLYDLFSINSAQDDFCLDHFEERFNENHGGDGCFWISIYLPN